MISEMKKIYFLFFITVLLGHLVYAQEKKSDTIDNSINHKFDVLLKTSNNYQDYKVVKKNQLLQLQQNTVQQINQLKDTIENAKKEIEKQDGKITGLQKELQSTNGELKQVNQEKNQVSFFGVATEKDTYQSLMIGIIVVLLVILAFFVYRYKNSLAVTKSAKEKFRASEEEFEDYKRVALEKQQKLGRQLQDERNKISKNKS